MSATPPDMLYEQALRAHAAGDRATAAALCGELLARDAGYAEAAFLLAAIAVEQGRPAVALPDRRDTVPAPPFSTAVGSRLRAAVWRPNHPLQQAGGRLFTCRAA